MQSQFSEFLSTAAFFCVYFVNLSINYLSHELHKLARIIFLISLGLIPQSFAWNFLPQIHKLQEKICEFAVNASRALRKVVCFKNLWKSF